MNYDISESVSQRGSGEETPENRRIYEVADELHRRCQLYETQLRDSQGDVNHLDVEQRVAELYAKENGMYLLSSMQKLQGINKKKARSGEPFSFLTK